MKQLTVGDLATMIARLINEQKDYKDIPIYLGNDDELNGVHCAWCCEVLRNSDADCASVIEMIDESAGNNKFDKIAILLS